MSTFLGYAKKEEEKNYSIVSELMENGTLHDYLETMAGSKKTMTASELFAKVCCLNLAAKFLTLPL